MPKRFAGVVHYLSIRDSRSVRRTEGSYVWLTGDAPGSQQTAAGLVNTSASVAVGAPATTGPQKRVVESRKLRPTCELDSHLPRAERYRPWPSTGLKRSDSELHYYSNTQRQPDVLGRQNRRGLMAEIVGMLGTIRS